MHLPCGVYKAHEHTGADGDWVLFIIDVREMDICINIISKCLIPNLFRKKYVYILAERRQYSGGIVHEGGHSQLW
jgi:hypothetical protein